MKEYVLTENVGERLRQKESEKMYLKAINIVLIDINRRC